VGGIEGWRMMILLMSVIPYDVGRCVHMVQHRLRRRNGIGTGITENTAVETSPMMAVRRAWNDLAGHAGDRI